MPVVAQTSRTPQEKICCQTATETVLKMVKLHVVDYDPVKELCCKKGESREISTISDNYKSCCGMTKYDPSHQICCHFGGT